MEMVKDPGVMQMMSTGQPLMLGTKKLDPGELIAEIIGLTTDNEKIITQVTPEEELEQSQLQAEEEQMMMQAEQAQEPQMPQEAPQVSPEEDYLMQLMEQFGVDQPTAMGMVAAEQQGYHPEEILEAVQRQKGLVNER